MEQKQPVSSWAIQAYWAIRVQHWQSVVPTDLVLWSDHGHVSPLAFLILVCFPNQELQLSFPSTPLLSKLSRNI